VAELNIIEDKIHGLEDRFEEIAQKAAQRYKILRIWKNN
jgi:hypothetical protein